MRQIVWGSSQNPDENRIMADWAANRIWGDDRRFGKCVTMGVVEGETLLGVIVFHDWNPHSGVIEYSGAALSPRWMSRDALNSMFRFIFDECGCQMTVTRNSEHNTTLHRQLKAYGHKPHRIERLRGPNEAEIVWTLTREDWAANRFNKERVR